MRYRGAMIETVADHLTLERDGVSPSSPSIGPTPATR
jgi:hypothetical protein